MYARIARPPTRVCDCGEPYTKNDCDLDSLWIKWSGEYPEEGTNDDQELVIGVLARFGRPMQVREVRVSIRRDGPCRHEDIAIIRTVLADPISGVTFLDTRHAVAVVVM